MERNVDYVAFEPQKESSWTFNIAGKAMNISEEVEEILGITEKIVEICEGFFYPRTIEYFLLTYSKDYPINNVFYSLGFDVKPLKVFEGKIELKENSIFCKEFRCDVQNYLMNDLGELRRIMIDGKIRFILEGKEACVGNNSIGELCGSDTVCAEESEGWTSSYPLWISVFHDYLIRNNEYVSINDLGYYRIVFSTWADIWFDDTEVGLANRNRFRRVLKSVYDSFDVVDTYFSSDRYSEEKLKNVVFGHS